MNVEVVFLPPIATELPSKLCVVIDVLRATSTLVSIFEAGAERVVLAESIPAALAYADGSKERPLVCGESGGLAPDGFDLGNSPREFRPEAVKGKELCFCTSNGTRAMRRVSSSPVVFAGCLLNGTSLARRAVREASARELDIAVVCSGDILGSKFAIDDAFTAGYLVKLMQREAAGPTVADAEADRRFVHARAIREDEAVDLELEESATAAIRLYESYLLEAGASDLDA
ncbi:MAG TPA: 2-phosphosulfolactate phosphatase, partial [Chloroflexota bacterium]|nr:2-phosphosulfolactate phosphatase [Chloroflexota bacterium]